jgi:glycogen debranching enzyme
MVNEIQRKLATHKKVIEESSFAGLPELTNQEGETCWHSCATQAWSSATILELLYDMKHSVEQR